MRAVCVQREILLHPSISAVLVLLISSLLSLPTSHFIRLPFLFKALPSTSESKQTGEDWGLL